MMNADVDSAPRRQATNLEAFTAFGVGALKAWAMLLAGSVVGYGLAVVVAWWSGWPLVELSWERLSASGWHTVVVLMYAMAGCQIEVLRFQGQPQPGRFFRAWASAGRLRSRLFLVLGMAAIGVGVLTGLCGPLTE
jgi:hypothetical protein